MRAVLLVVLALAGCASQTPGQRAWNACEAVKDYAAWGECFDRNMSRETHRSNGQSEAEAAATLLLLGITAFGEGYTSRRSSRVICTNIGGIVTCE